VVESDPEMGTKGKLSKVMKEMLKDQRALIQLCGNESSMGKDVMDAFVKTGVI
jgi:sulfite reductase alpha subunit-like flavoprotein